MIKVKSKEVIDGNEELEFSIDLTDDAQTTRMLRNIKKALVHSLKRDYKIINDEITDEILKIHGMHRDNFDFINNATKVINEKLNDISVDDNSNKNEKTIKGILQEAKTSVDKVLGYRWLYVVLKELYGKKEAKRLTGKMYDYSLAIADSTSMLVPYCWSIDASKLVILGKDFGQLHSTPAKRVDSYISVLNEVIHQLSSHLAGAIAIGTFFLDIAHLMIYKEKVSFEELKNNKKIRKDIENQFQRIVHGVNSLSRNAIESPFTNLSLFDRPKLKQLIAKENFGWYFDHNYNEYKEELHEKYIIEYIIELQNIYMNFFDKGDPSNSGLVYRFPISTVNLSKKFDEKINEVIIEDKEFLKQVCKKDIYRYNIFVSEGTKISSCCRLINNSEMLTLASQANSFGGGSSISLGSHRVVTIDFVRIVLETQSLESFYELLNKRVEDAAMILKAHKKLLQILTDKGLQSFISNGWINLNRMFSTFGIIGIVECEELLRKKYKFEKSFDVMKEILIKFNEYVSIFSEKYSITGNIEQIPGESMSVRLAKVDKLIFKEKNISWDIYANQFIPLWDTKSTIWERLKRDGEMNSLLTGGGICHINTGEEITSKQAQNIIQYSVSCGCEHFAITGTYCKCEDNHIFIGNKSKCSICGKSVIEKYARVVGFWTPVSSWSSTKQELDHNRRKEYSKENFEHGN